MTPPLDPTALAAARRGMAEQQAQRPDHAQLWFRVAGCAAPDDARVVTLVIGGDARSQIRLSRRALCIDPVLAPVLELAGRAAAELGDGTGAFALLRRAVLADPVSTVEAAFALSDFLLKTGNPNSAYPLAWRVAQLSPDNPAAQLRLATAASQTGRHDLAATAYLRASARLPAVTDLAVSAVLAARRVDRHAEAWPLARRAAAIDPGSGEAVYLMGEGAARPVGLSPMETWVRRATVALPGNVMSWEALGRSERGAGAFENSLAAARRGLLLAPGDAGCARSMAQAAVTLVDFDLGGRAARTGLTAHPGDSELSYLLAQVEKAVGDLGRGWDLEHLRAEGPRFHRTMGLPLRVSSDPLPQSGLLIAAEQGIGDELLFLSCLPELLAECPAPVVEADPRFHALLARSFPGLRLIARQVRAEGTGAIYDYTTVAPALGLTAFLHAGDLPGRYRRNRSRPCDRGGYLKADPVKTGQWRSRLAALDGEGPLVGICWRSMLQSGVRSFYYADLPDLLPILRLPGLRFVCLQYDDCGDELDALRRDHGIAIWKPEDLDQIEDLDGVAALMAALDVVVSTATSVCVLAAAVGCETIRLAPSFYNILDDRDLFFANVTPTIHKDERMEVSVAIGRAAALLAARAKPAE